MVFALASVSFVNNGIAFNLSQVNTYSRIASSNGADLVCFGEAFLQGFDSLSWNYEIDKGIAITQDSLEMASVKHMSLDHHIDILLGDIEREQHNLYSSCALITEGCILTNYRRISKGWKKPRCDENHYKEGDDVQEFEYKNKVCKIAICGDLWDCKERFLHCEMLFWPVFVDFTEKQWEDHLQEYADQASVCARTFMINSISKESKAIGGSACFSHNSAVHQYPLHAEGLLYV